MPRCAGRSGAGIVVTLQPGIAALGIACPIGTGKAAVARGLLEGSRRGLLRRPDLAHGHEVYVGAVNDALPALPSELSRFDCRNNRLMLLALREIAAELGNAIARFGAHRIAVVLGTSTAGIAEGEAAYVGRKRTGTWPTGFAYEQQETGNLAELAAQALGITGPAYTIATACSSTGKVFASARRLMQAGICDAAIVGGADTLSQMTVNGFRALEAVSRGYCNPFSRNRDGINIGEAAAAFLLTPEAAEVNLKGVGESSDAHHMSAPDPEGHGARAAISAALVEAALSPEAIGYVNLHGTGTPLNDQMEGEVVHRLFGPGVPCGSTKGMTGHTLGAAGACEAAFLWLTLHPDYNAGRLPPHVWDGIPDPRIPALNLVGQNARQSHAVEHPAMLSNSFAFGGNNVSVILGRS
jgi:3-oxoacyl-[acyl-carrier-protein] synthase-1